MMKEKYAVIGTFVNCDNDVVIDYCDTLEQAEITYQAVDNDTYEEYGDLEFVRIVKFEIVK